MVSRFNQNAEAKRKVDLVRTNPSGSKTIARDLPCHWTSTSKGDKE